MPGDLPNPDQYRIPTVEELDAWREDLGLSRRELSKRAGREGSAWSEIVTTDISPQLSTVQRFLDVLRDADPNGDRPQQGRRPRLRSDGGHTGGDDR